MGSHPYQSPLDPVKVLVVDPSDRARLLFPEALAEHGCDLLFSDNGFDALGKIHETMPNMVFIVDNAPRLDGYQVSRLIRANSRLKDLPIVLMSHDPDLFDRARARMVGASEHLIGELSPEKVFQSFLRQAR